MEVANNNEKAGESELCELNAACLFKETGKVSELLALGADVNSQTKDAIVPNLTPLHLAVQRNAIDIVKELLTHGQIDPNRQDQWGFTALHYATMLRNKALVTLLISRGASVMILSKAGSSALDVAKQSQFEDIVSVLNSKAVLETDPNIPRLRDWLTALGAGDFVGRFIDAGYDFQSIAKLGLDDEDLDCVGISKEKQGLRKKLKNLARITEFQIEDEEEEEEEDEEEESEDEEEDD